MSAPGKPASMNNRRVHSLLALGSWFALASGCSSAKPAPEQATETPTAGNEGSSTDCGASAPQSPEHCECLGGYVKGDIGDGKVACTDGETELERVQQGIEGAVCCKANTP